MLDGYLTRGLALKNVLEGTVKKRGMEPPFMPEVSFHIDKADYGRLDVVEHGGWLRSSSVCCMRKTRISAG